MDQPKLERDVVIGDDAALVAGMEIGDRCVIGAWLCGYVVDPAGSIAVGNPARVLGHKAMRRFGKRISCRALPEPVTIDSSAAFQARKTS